MKNDPKRRSALPSEALAYEGCSTAELRHRLERNHARRFPTHADYCEADNLANEIARREDAEAAHA